MNNECYYFEKIVFNKGLLDDSIDRTYIIHLEGNGRIESIYKQLEEYHPTKEVYILFNKGFKKCNKKLEKYTSVFDLVDAFITIFNHAIDQNNILILEDDFFFDKEIKNKEICDDINKFIIEKKDKEFIYYLGAIPYITIPYKDNHRLLLLSTGTHSCIYSKNMRKNTLKNKTNWDWDLHTNFNYIRYIYEKPLCYQLFPETENSKNWPLGSIILKFIFKLNNLDKNENGYKNFYFFSKIIFYIIIFIIVYYILKKK